nr:hypothetical protein [Tanacetum cinerariifolium]
VDDEIVAEDQPYAEDASPIAQLPEYVPKSDLEAHPEDDDDEDPEEDPDEIVETLQGAPVSTDTELSGYVREFETRVRQDTDEIYMRLDDEQTE